MGWGTMHYAFTYTPVKQLASLPPSPSLAPSRGNKILASCTRLIRVKIEVANITVDPLGFYAKRLPGWGVVTSARSYLG